MDKTEVPMAIARLYAERMGGLREPGPQLPNYLLGLTTCLVNGWENLPGMGVEPALSWARANIEASLTENGLEVFVPAYLRALDGAAEMLRAVDEMTALVIAEAAVGNA